MPQITIKDVGTFDVDEGTRLVRAIAQNGVDIGHRCGGHAGCTTCRCTIADGEPDVMTRAEYDKLRDIKQLGNFRLACQIVVDRDMTVEPLMRASEKGWDDAGPEPDITVHPDAEWFPIAELKAEDADDGEAEDA